MKLYRMATIEPVTNLITHISVWLSPADAPTLVEVMPWLNVGDNIYKPEYEDIESIEEP